ncbi:hypothetical protein KQC08_02220, partial [Leptospira sp. Pond_2020]|nr:hypothetical protein [Leptospira sp. Pond_2020]
MDKDNAIYVPDYDIVFYKMPSSCKLFVKIIQYFVTEEDMDKPLPHTGQLLAHPTDDDMVCRQIEVTFKKYERAMKIRDKHQNTSIVNAESLVYNYSEKGICGAVLSLPKTQRPLCGVHYAGSQGAYAYTGEGMAVII